MYTISSVRVVTGRGYCHYSPCRS